MCRLRLIPKGAERLPRTSIRVGDVHGEPQRLIEGYATDEGHREYKIPGGSTVHIIWETDPPVTRPRKQRAKRKKHAKAGDRT